MLKEQLQPALAGVKPDFWLGPAPRGRSEELERYHATLQDAALTVRHVLVPDALRLAFWAHPQMAPWRKRLKSRSRKDRAVQAALSLLLDTAVASRGCRLSGWYFTGYKRLECLTGQFGRGGLAAIHALQDAFLSVGLRLRWTPHHFRDRLTRTYRIDGLPEELERQLAALAKGGLVAAPARLDNPDLTPTRPSIAKERAARKRLQQAIEERVTAQVERMPPLRRERAQLLNEGMPDLGGELRERLAQAVAVAEQVGRPETVEALRRIADVGKPLVTGRAASASARLGGALSLGQLPSAVLRAFVGNVVELDVTASTPSIAAAFVGDARVSAFFADCAERGESPVARIADAAFARLGFPAVREEDRAAGTKAVKALLITALCGGGDRAQRLHAPLSLSGGRSVAGFRAAARQHFVVSTLVTGVWGPGGIAARLLREGSVQVGTGATISLLKDRAADAPRLHAQVRRAIAAAYCDEEARGIVAALRAAKRSAHFRPVADKHDGIVLQRLGSGRAEDELARICAAGEAALRERGIVTRLRVRYDADFPADERPLRQSLH